MSLPATRGRDWIVATAIFSVLLLVTLAAYRETAASFIRVWANSETFAHGFLIVPISGYLVSLKRDSLALLAPRSCPLALLLLPPIGLAWLAGHATNTLLVEQVTFVAFFPVLTCVVFGTRVARLIAFPLGFLFFAVPLGDAFLPTLMDLTAGIAVRALQLSGVPVAREGLFLTTPIAQWRVSEACSGLRYLVSGFALACVFAYVTYASAWKRLACAGLSIVVLIVANGVRAYVLVLVGYLSQMRLGGGFDHYAFGWIVYISVMVAFFAVGSAFRDAVPVKSAVPGRVERGGDTPPPARPGRDLALAGMAVAALAFWPLAYSYLSGAGPDPHEAQISLPLPRSGWTIVDLVHPWQPAFAGSASETIGTYAKDGATVVCHLGFYKHQRQDRELLHHRNVIVDPGDRYWRNLGERDRRIQLGREALLVRETDVHGPDGRFLAWHWYWFPDEFTINPEWAKLLQARASLLLRRDHAAVVVLYASTSDHRNAASILQQFVREMLPSIQFAIHYADTSR